jgi:ribosomal protein S8
MNKNFIEFLTSLKNASLFKKEYLIVKSSKIILETLRGLYDEGFVQSYKLTSGNVIVLLRYFFNKPILKNLKVLSTPSKTRHFNLKLLSKLSKKKTVCFFSTNKGIITLAKCKKLNSGGIALFFIN